MRCVDFGQSETVADVITGLGGAAKVSRELGLKGPSTVSEMKRRNSIPVAYWPQLIALAVQAGHSGLSDDTLVRVHLNEAA